jgi:hypothetical protein
MQQLECIEGPLASPREMPFGRRAADLGRCRPMTPATFRPALRIAILGLGLSVMGCSGEEAKGPTFVPVSACTETFTACGGNEIGTWSLTSVCSDSSLTGFFNSALATDYPSCGQTFTEVTMSTTGTVAYDGSNYTRTGSIHTRGKMKITAACVAEQLQNLPLTANACGNLAAVLPSQYPGSTFSCTYDGITCNCDIASVDSLDAKGTYVKSATGIDESVNQVNYAYCVNGNAMTQRGALVSIYTGTAELVVTTQLTK